MSTFAAKYLAPKVHCLGVMDKKIPALTKAIARTANAASALGPYVRLLCAEQNRLGQAYHMHKCLPCRFVRLWKARNRRSRVLMRRIAEWRIAENRRRAILCTCYDCPRSEMKASGSIP